MQTPKHTKYLFTALLLLSISPTFADDMNADPRGLGDYPWTSPRQKLLQGHFPQTVPTAPRFSTHIELNSIEVRSINSPPKPAFDPQKLKLNLDLPTFPQLNPAPINQLFTPAAPTLVSPATIPTTPPKK